MFLAWDQGLSGIERFGTGRDEPYRIDEEAGEHGVPLSGMRFALVRVFSAIYLLKVAWRGTAARKDTSGRKVSAYQLPRKSRIRGADQMGGRREFLQVEAGHFWKGYLKTSGCMGIWYVPRLTRSLDAC